MREETVTFDPHTFVYETFAFAVEALKPLTTTFDGERLWYPVPAYPSLETAAIESVLREHKDTINSETASMILSFSCVQHINLIPVMLELFKSILIPNSILDAIYAYEKRYPETCWLIMTECVDLLRGSPIGKCFYICCSAGNVSMLGFLIDSCPGTFKSDLIGISCFNMSINLGIGVCCKNGDMDMVKVMIAKCKWLALYVLKHGAKRDIEMVKLVIDEYNEYLSADSEFVKSALANAAKREDEDMLELLINEFGADMPCKFVRSAFVTCCSRSKLLSAEILLERFLDDLYFDDGLGPVKMWRGKPSEAVWSFMKETYGSRLRKNAKSWWIRCD